MLRSSRTRSFTVLCRRSITSASQYNHGAISGGQTHTNLHRKPVRGGQNLSGRWTRLENSLRQKAALSKELEGFAEHDASLPKDLQPKFVSKAKSAPLFHGFIVPEEPNPPADNGAFPFMHTMLPCINWFSKRMLHVWMCRLRLRSPRGIS